MNVVCIGGGPAGLYLGILLKLADSAHRVRVYERNRPDDTFGFGVVFSDATLGNLAAADPLTHAAIRANFAHWDDIEIHHRGEIITSTGHGFCGIERRRLLAVLQARAIEVGVEVLFETELPDANTLTDCDLIVAADGVASGVRTAFADQFAPEVDARPNKFVWLGTTVPFRAFTFLFTPTPYGLFRVHAYRYAEHGSTFIVECTDATWHRAGFADADEDTTVAKLQTIFAHELAGHPLIKNRSIWRNFPNIRCGSWQASNRHNIPMVLLGDAVHTAHFSIGSGTKLALEDAIALRDAITTQADLGVALAHYQAARRPEVLSLQAAAQTSLEWFEGTERYMAMSAAQFAYSLMTRSGRVSHASMQKRDAALAARVEAELGVVAPNGPTEAAWKLGQLSLPGRLVALSAASAFGAASPPAATTTPDVTTRVVATCTPGPRVGDLCSYWLPCSAGNLLVVVPPDNVQVTAAELAVFQQHANQIAVVIDDDAEHRFAAIAYAMRLQGHGVAMIGVRAQATPASPRVAAAPLADVIRNQLHVATALLADGASLADLQACIAGGRADLIIVRVPDTSC
ncbi:MAG: FAD-dependent monooxygenase [Kofleriaceae bacterium]|nr:FAD-dependent monooxygenase [Kofleriaceae bacterium]